MKQVIIVMLGLFLTTGAWGEDKKPEARRANGRPVPGTVIQASEKGLQVSTPRGERVLSWKQLSAGTRYRHEPGFRERFAAEVTKPKGKKK